MRPGAGRRGDRRAPAARRITAELARAWGLDDVVVDPDTVAALARRLGVPFRSGGSLTACKIPDARAAYESAATLIPTLMGGVNFVLHAAGWLDVDQLGMMEVFAKGVDLSENAQAVDAIVDNGPGQHVLGTAHTLANFETAFHRSTTADIASYEQWTEKGSLDAAQRAAKQRRAQLAGYEPPPIDDAIDAELRDNVERRKASMPDEIG